MLYGNGNNVIKRRKLQLSGHICSTSVSRLVKTVMSGMTDHKGDQLGGGLTTSVTGAIAT